MSGSKNCQESANDLDTIISEITFLSHRVGEQCFLVDNMGVFADIFHQYLAIRETAGGNVWSISCQYMGKITEILNKYGRILAGGYYYQGYWLQVNLPVPQIGSEVSLYGPMGLEIRCVVDSIIIDNLGEIEYVQAHNTLTYREIFQLFVENGTWRARDSNNHWKINSGDWQVKFQDDRLPSKKHYRFMIVPRFVVGSRLRQRSNPHNTYQVMGVTYAEKQTDEYRDELNPQRLLIVEARLVDNNGKYRKVRLDYLEGWKFC